MQSFFEKKITIYSLFKSILKEAHYKKRSGVWGLAPFATKWRKGARGWAYGLKKGNSPSNKYAFTKSCAFREIVINSSPV